MKRAALFGLMIAALLAPAAMRGQSCVTQSQATLIGTLRAANGLPAVNDTITLTPSQMGFIAGCGVNLAVATECATSADGTVVQTPNPLSAALMSTTGTGTLPAATYYVVFAWYDALGHVTLISPEVAQQLSVQGTLVVSPPASGVPATAAGMRVYIATTSGAETLQGSSTGAAAYAQSAPLVSGAALPGTNTTACVATANDAVWPVGTGYRVTMTDPSGNALPGYPMQWQLIGPGGTINLANGLPYYNGVVFYPTPILAAPQGHGQQSISGPLSLSNYMLNSVSRIGVGTALPAWPIDVENGAVNASGGFILNGGSGVSTGNCLLAGSDTFHTFNVPANCLTALPTVYYQTVAANGSAQTPRPTLNFASRFTLADAASPAQSTVDLASSGVTAASYTAANITVDAYGRVTSAANGTAVLNRAAHNVTGSRAFGSTYQNTNGIEMEVSGNGQEIGSGNGSIVCEIGSTSGLGSTPWSNRWSATEDDQPAGFKCTVPVNFFYRLSISGNIHPLTEAGSNWYEYY